jgi:hypothetical protein
LTPFFGYQLNILGRKERSSFGFSIDQVFWMERSSAKKSSDIVRGNCLI